MRALLLRIEGGGIPSRRAPAGRAGVGGGVWPAAHGSPRCAGAPGRTRHCAGAPTRGLLCRAPPPLRTPAPRHGHAAGFPLRPAHMGGAPHRGHRSDRPPGTAHAPALGKCSVAHGAARICRWRGGGAGNVVSLLARGDAAPLPPCPWARATPQGEKPRTAGVLWSRCEMDVAFAHAALAGSLSLEEHAPLYRFRIYGYTDAGSVGCFRELYLPASRFAFESDTGMP